ncbi:glutamate racemase [Candidatus Curculioniphilus buchneri]|uniref:glutamate racemase n=1 Tax=Candidatus Curculioniphilus buchneri TaxID=690594 RepID=UPI00376F3013
MVIKLKNKQIKIKSKISDFRTIKCPTILIIDSGVGGLSIYDKVRQLLPHVCYLYVFDNAAFPYGNKTTQFIIDRMIVIINAMSILHQLDLVILACNTASTASLPLLRNYFNFPIIGVVPAIKPAAKITRNGIIGLLATHATVQCSYVYALINQFAKNCQILRFSAPELVELAEAKFYGEVVSLSTLRQLFHPWLSMIDAPDTIVLGCTHFPFLNRELQTIFPHSTYLVDSGTAIAYRTLWLVNHCLNINCTQDFSKFNQVYCLTTTMTKKVVTMMSNLNHYGFKSIKQLII